MTPRARPLRKIAPWLFGLLLALAYTYRQLFSGKVAAARDTFRLFIPDGAFVLQSLHAGKLPLWIPYERLGEPFAAIPYSLAFYPPNLVALLLVGPVWAPTVLQVFHAATAAAGLYLAARSLGRTRAASALAGAVFALTPFFFELSFILNVAAAAAWSGFIVAGAVALTRRPSWRAVALLALPFALSLLSGSPETTLCQGLVALAIVLPRRRAGRSVGALAVASGWAALLSAVMLLPGLELARHSMRSLHRSQLDWSTPLGQLVSAFLPLADQPRSSYWGADQFFFLSLFLGATTLVLVLLGTRRRTAALALAAGFLAVLAMGRYTLPSRWLLTHPPLALFRYPAKYFTGFALCSALLAGFGLDRLGALARRIAPSARRAAFAGGGIALLFLFALPLVQRPLFRSGLQFGLTWLSGTLVVLAVAFFTIPKGPKRGERVRLAFGLMLALELAAYVTRFPPSGWVSAKSLAAPSVLASAIPRPFEGRVSVVLPYDEDPSEPGGEQDRYVERSRDALVPLMSTMDRLPTAEGYGAPEPVSENLVLPPTPRAVYALLGVGYFVRPEKAPYPDATAVASVPGIATLFRVPGAMPRAFVVYRAQPADNLQALAAVQDEHQPFRNTAFTADGPALEAPVGCPEFTPAQLKDGLDTLEIDLDACAAGLLVVTDSYFPGWEATLDGRPAAIERVDLIVRGVRVGPGKHHLVMRYRPASFRAGAALSLLALGALLLGLFGRRRARAT